jgi:hypothetical protein
MASAMLVSINHRTTDDNSGKNKFAAVPSEIPTPHSDQFQQQLQAQMRQLKQLQQQFQ